MKRNLAVFVLMFAFALGASAQGLKVGDKVGDFTLTDTSGKMQSLKDLKGKNGSVLIFVSAQCPVVKAYIPRIDEIASEYKAKGINFIGVNANSRDAESLQWVTTDAAESFKFPMLIDSGNVLADKLGATVTPEVYFLDPENTLLYHGAIDNDRSGKNIQEKYARSAFDAALAGKKIEKAKTNAFGCSIKRVSSAGKGQ